jgi:hypothetical protein
VPTSDKMGSAASTCAISEQKPKKRVEPQVCARYNPPLTFAR